MSAHPDDPDRDALILARGDHNEEVAAYRVALEAVIRKYWFIGQAELVGGLEIEKFELLRSFEVQVVDDGDEWKDGARS